MTPPHNGTPTSRAAAQSISTTAATLRSAVLGFIAARGMFGATDEEVQEGLPMQPNTERPRRVELYTLGLIERTDMRRKTRSGRDAAVWIVKGDAT